MDFERAERTFKRSFIAILIFNLALFAAIIYVAVHFISMYW